MSESPLHTNSVSPPWKDGDCEDYHSLKSPGLEPKSLQDDGHNESLADPAIKSVQDEALSPPMPLLDTNKVDTIEEFSKDKSEDGCPADGEQECCDDDQNLPMASDDADASSILTDDPDQHYMEDFHGNSMSEEDNSVTSHECMSSSNSYHPPVMNSDGMASVNNGPGQFLDCNRHLYNSFDANLPVEEDDIPVSSCMSTPVGQCHGGLNNMPNSEPGATNSSHLVEVSSLRICEQSSSDEAVDFSSAFKSNKITKLNNSNGFESSPNLTTSLLKAVNASIENEATEKITSSLTDTRSTSFAQSIIQDTKCLSECNKLLALDSSDCTKDQNNGSEKSSNDATRVPVRCSNPKAMVRSKISRKPSRVSQRLLSKRISKSQENSLLESPLCPSQSLQNFEDLTERIATQDTLLSAPVLSPVSFSLPAILSSPNDELDNSDNVPKVLPAAQEYVADNILTTMPSAADVEHPADVVLKETATSVMQVIEKDQDSCKFNSNKEENTDDDIDGTGANIESSGHEGKTKTNSIQLPPKNVQTEIFECQEEAMGSCSQGRTDTLLSLIKANNLHSSENFNSLDAGGSEISDHVCKLKNIEQSNASCNGTNSSKNISDEDLSLKKGYTNLLKKPKNEERITNNDSDNDSTADELPDIDAGNCLKKMKRTELASEAPTIENLEELPDVDCMQSPSQSDQKESQTSKVSDYQVDNTSPVMKPEKISKTDPQAFPLRKKRLCKPCDEYSVTLPSKSDGKTLIFTRKPTFSLAGSSRDTAEETSARYYQNYLRCKRRIADYERKLREQFTDTDSDDSIEHYKREADRRRWMDKKAILSERMKNLVALNGGPFDVDLALKNTDDSCDDLPSLYPPSSCAAVDTMNDLMDEALNSSKTGSDDDIIVEDKSSFRRRVKHTLGFKRRPKMWQKKRKCDDSADVVDLTNEIDSNDDGDVEVLQHDKPVVYLKTESRRKKRRSSLRLTENNSTTAAAAAQTIDLVAPEAAIQPQPIDFNDPNLLFGTLLEQPERFVVPKLDEKQDSPDSTNIKATSGPDLLAASGPLNKISGNSDEGHLCSGSGSSNAPNKVDPLIPSHLYAGPSASSFSSNSSRDPHRLDDKSPVAIEKIWEMLNIPDEDMQTVRLHHQASSSGSLPVPDSVCLPNYGRSASPPSPYRTAPPPGCCPDNDSLHDSVTRPLNLKSGPGALVSGAAIDNSDMHIGNNTTASSSQGPHGDISQGAAQTRSLINHAAQPNKVDMGHRPFLQPNRFGPSQSSSNPFGIGPSTFLPINRPTGSGREPLTGASTSSSQDEFISRYSSSASRSCNGLQRAPSGPIFPSTSASFIGPLVNPFLSKRPIMNGSQPELPSGRIEPSLTGRNHTFPSMPPSQACTRVMRSASIPSNPLHPVPWVRMFRENDPVPSSAFSNPMGAAAGASIPLPPSVTTQCASASVFPFSGSTRPYVSSSLMSMNMQGSSSIANPTAAGVAGPSNNNSAQNDLRRDVSGPLTAASTSTNNSSRTSLASARGANDVMVLGEDDDMNVVNISTPAEEEDDEPESEEASTEPSSPDDTERSSRSDKPTSAAPPAPAKSKASSSSGNDFEISCPICFDTLMDIKERRGHLVSTVCGHLFCEVCLDAAVRRTKQCPTCRRRLTKRQFHKLFI